MICGSGDDDDDNMVQHHPRILPGPAASLDDRTSPGRIFTWQISVNSCAGTVLLWRVLGEILHVPSNMGGLAIWTVKPKKPLKVGVKLCRAVSRCRGISGTQILPRVLKMRGYYFIPKFIWVDLLTISWRQAYKY